MIKFLENMWLMVAIVCVFLAAYKSLFIGYEEGLYFAMFAVLATVLWLLRRRMRRHMENSKNKSEQ